MWTKELLLCLPRLLRPNVVSNNQASSSYSRLSSWHQPIAISRYACARKLYHCCSIRWYRIPCLNRRNAPLQQIAVTSSCLAAPAGREYTKFSMIRYSWMLYFVGNLRNLVSELSIRASNSPLSIPVIDSSARKTVLPVSVS